MTFDKTTYRLTGSSGFGKIALIAGIAGLALSALGLFTNSKQFNHSYLTAFVFWWTLCMGGLFFTMLHHLTNATWSIVLRRIAENIMMVLPWMALFVIPVFFGMNDLYKWSLPEVMETDYLIQKKAAYLNVPFFIARTVFYFAVWIILSFSLYRVSVKQDSGHSDAILKRMRVISAPGMILFAITISFAGIDWMMTMDAHWYSTIYGVYVFAGCLLSFLGLITLIGKMMEKRDILTGTITGEHFHDLGRLMFAFTIFWAYIAFSQYFLIWYANIPEETLWYLHRWEGSWKVISMLILFGHFIIPFLLLMTRAAKRNSTFMKIIAAWFIFIHWVDIYWLIGPNLHHHSAHFSWMDLTTVVGIGGILVWLFMARLSSQPLVPVGDPRLQASIDFKN